MKRVYSTVAVAVFLLFCLNGLQAQTTQIKLNHVELFKQFVGTWKGEMGKDTTFIMVMKSFHDAFECYVKTETRGEILMEEKTLIGYDKRRDLLIEAGLLNNSPEIILWAVWFTSSNKCEEVFLHDISNPEEAIYKWTFELPTPDLFVWTSIVNNKTTGTYTFHREKN
jgi:hypothetical protein